MRAFLAGCGVRSAIAVYGPIFPNLARDIVPTGTNRLWVSDITYVALPTRFVCVAVILEALSRMIVGYAIGRSIDARLTRQP
ncbi:DDE-type integrase/transposase/recombinase [Mesorhizobium sp. WSM3864]|uniref:DDE-type integrase/transposase/recombinase n=1 Tax=Mesorhizobium sp. WSM3864 TaxID=2029404 RepID=UPI0011409931|nr:DDE-type integrase/transposase/recombinase [Mesorhizobium sp. WSM3864]